MERGLSAQAPSEPTPSERSVDPLTLLEQQLPKHPPLRFHSPEGKRQTYAQLVAERAAGSLERELTEYIRDLPFLEIPTYDGLPPPRKHTYASERAAAKKVQAEKQRQRDTALASLGLATGVDDHPIVPQHPSEFALPPPPGDEGLRIGVSSQPQPPPVFEEQFENRRSAEYRYCVQELAREFHAPLEQGRKHIPYTKFRDTLAAPQISNIRALDPQVQDVVVHDERQAALQRTVAAVMESGPAIPIEPVELKMTTAEYEAQMAELSGQAALQRKEAAAEEAGRAAASQRFGPLNMFDLAPPGAPTIHMFRSTRHGS